MDKTEFSSTSYIEQTLSHRQETVRCGCESPLFFMEKPCQFFFFNRQQFSVSNTRCGCENPLFFMEKNMSVFFL